ncbi:MAG: LysR family transcriptional regulator [Oscillibacter sp.]|nr:LysR family transcriptional regulator [Oscillibacter sp.]
MNIRKCEAFVRAVELGSISKAAEELGYTQSGLSHMMQSLEEEAGFPLMVRTSSGIRPNSEGELLLPIIRQLLNTNESLEQYIAQIRGADTGRIRIAAYPSVATYWLPGILREFQKDYPHVEIQITEMGSGAIETIMADHQAELCIYAGGAGKDFEWVPLCRDRMLALVPPGHPLAAGQSVPLAALEREEFIMPMPDYDGEVRFVLDKLAAWPHICFSACSDYAIINMVTEGLGISILSELLLEHYSHQAVALPMDPPQDRELGIGVPQMKTASPMTRNFIRYVERYVRQRRPPIAP